MAEVWKVEYQCIVGTTAVAWFATLDDAKAYAAAHPMIDEIEEVSFYSDERRTVWERGA